VVAAGDFCYRVVCVTAARLDCLSKSPRGSSNPCRTNYWRDTVTVISSRRPIGVNILSKMFRVSNQFKMTQNSQQFYFDVRNQATEIRHAIHFKTSIDILTITPTCSKNADTKCNCYTRTISFPMPTLAGFPQSNKIPSE